MSNFVVSARKYRPARFDEVVGQQHVSQTLKNALQTDHLAHAFLFCGPRGVGKTTCARILAKVLNCQNRTEDYEPCNECASCTAFNDNASLNITELDAASNNSVDHIRALIEQVRFQPQQGQYKVFIIDEVHMLSQAAFNAFLKTLEEPPPYAIFILATTEKHKIIPTILSRCQIFDFKRIQIPAMVEHLQGICSQESIEADPDALHVIAQKADGALRDALSIFDRVTAFSGDQISYEAVIDNLNVLDYDYYFRAVDFLLTEDRSGLLLLLREVLDRGFDGDLFINGLAGHLRNLLVVKDPQTLPLLEVGERLRQRYHQQSALTGTALLLTALNLANDCDVEYRQATNKPLHVELCLLKMASIHRAREGQPLVEVSAPPPEKKTEERNDVRPDREHEAGENGITEQGGKEEEEVQKAVTDESENDTSPSPDTQHTAETGAAATMTQLNQDDLMAQIRAETAGQAASDPEPEIEAETLQAAWQAYLGGLEGSSQALLLKDAILEPNGREVRARVGSQRALAALRDDASAIQHLRQALNAPRMALRVELDESLRAARPQPKKRLSPKEKYLDMRAKNPAIDELRKRFDLRPEE